ncbi:lipopolysaccharide biosynthesis protein [Neptunicella sp.]|uniref:lipopolysaccharide biosynthesis protein n=1 Tax=Neptunicella sp. TaxID=2125986 RepID=UPI003F694201
MSSIKKSLVWSFSERYISQIITLISSMVLARLLTPEEVGIFSLCAALTMMLTIFRDFGVSEYIIQEKELTKNKLTGAYALAFVMAWSIGFILFLVKDSIASFYQEPGVAHIIAVQVLSFLVLPLASPGFALLNREMSFNKIFLVQTPSTLIHAITAISLAYAGYSYMSLAWASLASIISQTILVTYLRPKESLLMPSLKQMRYVWRFGMTFSLSRTIEVVMNNAHELIISHQFGFAQLGIFSRAMGLVNLFWVNVTSAVTRVAAPSFALSFHKSRENLLADYCNAIAYFTALAWPFFAFVALESENIIYILFGDQWLAAAPIATILACSQFICTFSTLAPNVLVATGHVKKRLWISMIIAPIHIIGIIIASYFSVYWIAGIWALTWSIAMVLYNYHLYQITGFTYKQLFKSASPSMFICIMTIAPVTLIKILEVDSMRNSISIFLLNCILFAIAWLIMIYVTKHPFSRDISSVINNLRKHKRI